MRVREWLIASVVAVLLLHGFVVVRSALHLHRARDLAKIGKTFEAAREYQGAIGFHAPLNPYCRTAAHELHALAETVAPIDPALGADLEDRLQGSLRGARSLYQPHGELVDSPALLTRYLLRPPMHQPIPATAERVPTQRK